MHSNNLTGAIPRTVCRFILSEGSPITIPDGSIPLKSEVVCDSEGVEILEVWLAVPSTTYMDTSESSPKEGKTIYTNTVTYNESRSLDDYESFSNDIESSVQQKLDDYYDDDDEDWDD